VAVCLVTTLLQIFHRMRQWKNFENRSIFGKDMDKTLSLTFLGHPVYPPWFPFLYYVIVLLIILRVLIDLLHAYKHWPELVPYTVFDWTKRYNHKSSTEEFIHCKWSIISASDEVHVDYSLILFAYVRCFSIQNTQFHILRNCAMHIFIVIF